MTTSNRFQHQATPKRVSPGFSLIELMIAVAVLSIMLVFFGTVTQTVSDTWAQSESRVEAYQSGRAALELISRELTPAVVDTHMQMVVGPADILTNVGAEKIAPNSPFMLWMAPLGPGGDLRVVGYYLYQDDERQFYRLKRIFMGPAGRKGRDDRNAYFPEMVSLNSRRGGASSIQRTESATARWFIKNWNQVAFDDEDPDNDRVIVSTAADGVVAFWVQCLDSLGNPIPWLSETTVNHPTPNTGDPELYFNSAALFQMATTRPFNDKPTGEAVNEDDITFQYMADGGLAMKGNRVPAAVDLTVVTLDNRALALRPRIPEIENVLTDKGTLDVDESIRLFNEALLDQNIRTARVFTTRVKLVNGN